MNAKGLDIVAQQHLGVFISRQVNESHVFFLAVDGFNEALSLDDFDFLFGDQSLESLLDVFLSSQRVQVGDNDFEGAVGESREGVLLLFLDKVLNSLLVHLLQLRGNDAAFFNVKNRSGFALALLAELDAFVVQVKILHNICNINLAFCFIERQFSIVFVNSVGVVSGLSGHIHAGAQQSAQHGSLTSSSEVIDDDITCPNQVDIVCA